jgi:hypothetical protein
MTAVKTSFKTDAQVFHLADNGLPVTSADVRRLMAEKTRLRAALEDVIRANDEYMSDCPMNEPDPVTEACRRARAVLGD